MEALIGFINVALQLGSLVLIAVLTSMGLVTTGTLAGGVNLIGGVANGFNSLAGLRLSLSASKPYFASCQRSILIPNRKRLLLCHR